MRIEQRDTQASTVLTGLIVSTKVLAAVVARWPDGEGLFADKCSNVVAGWCVRHYRKYGKAPGAAIEGVFQRWADKASRDPDLVDLIGKFLGGLSGEYVATRRKMHALQVIDTAQDEFNRVRLWELVKDIDGHLKNNDVGKAQEAVYAGQSQWIRLAGMGTDVGGCLRPTKSRWQQCQGGKNSLSRNACFSREIMEKLSKVAINRVYRGICCQVASQSGQETNPPTRRRASLPCW
jgi:hypothetical protein